MLAARTRWLAGQVLPDPLGRRILTAPVPRVAAPVAPHGGRAAFAYLSTVFLQPSTGRFARAHQNSGSARRWATALAGGGWEVDAFHHDWTTPSPGYRLVVGADPAFGALRAVNPGATTIQVLTTADPLQQARALDARRARADRSRGRALARPAPAAAPPAPDADVVAAVASRWSARTWADRGVVVEPYFEAPARAPQRHARAPGSARGVLWFSSRPLLHKGLDLCLEALAGRTDVTLHVVGPVDGDPAFGQAWAAELGAPNVVVHGWLDVGGEAFARVVRACRHVVVPSVSEAMPGSVVLAVGQGLLPVTTPAAAVDLPDDLEVVVDLDADLDGAAERLREAVLSALDVPEDELEDRSRAAVDVIARRHDPAACTERLAEIVAKAGRLSRRP